MSGAFILTSGVPYSIPTNIGESYSHGFTLGLKGIAYENWRWGLNYRFEEISEEFSSFAQALSKLFVDYDHTTPTSV